MNKYIIPAVIALVVSGIVGAVVLGSIKTTDVNQGDLSGLSERDVQAVSVKVGSTGTKLTSLIATTCNLIGTNASQTASTTVAYDCAVTGATSSFKVMAQLASSTPVTGQNNWSIQAAKASTTAGYVTVLLRNEGVAAVPSATSVGSSTVVLLFK